MNTMLRLLICLLAMVGLGACDSMELTLGVAPGPDETLLVHNANDAVWEDARLVVEAEESDGSTRICAEQARATWQPGEEIRVPACAAKVRLTLTVAGEVARFAYVNGQLYRRFGRKEVPVPGARS